MVDRPSTERTAVAVVVLAAVSGFGVWVLADGTAPGAARPTELRSCTTIDEPGRYVLAENLTDREADTCLRVRSSDVVLDGAGHAVDGVGAFGTAGVVVEPSGGTPLSNVTVRAVTVTDWDDGIRLVSVVESRVAGTTTADNRVGLQLLDARRNTLVDNHARDNQLRGISLVESSANNTLRANAATHNAVFGFHLVEAGVRDNTLVGNTAADNEFGVVLIGAHDNAVVDSTATGNRLAGVWLSGARENRVAGNVVSDGFYGVFLSERANGNTVANNTADANRVGVRLRSSDDNVVRSNAVRGSRDTAILLISSDGNRVVGNAGAANRRGVVVLRSTGNVVANNSVG